MGSWGDWQDVLRHADVETARLIIQLQLEDIGQAAPLSTHGSTDGGAAADIYMRELRRCAADLPSRALGEDLEDDENDFEGARESAAFGWKYNEYKNTVELAPEPVQLITCTACADEHDPIDTAKMPCSHYYCKGCLEGLYTSCMTDETLFPPRCCHQEFPWEMVRLLLSQRCRSAFGQKRIELETKDRTYCYLPTCSAFIRPSAYTTMSFGNDFATCPNPGKHADNAIYTCVECKNQNHAGGCPRDLSMDILMSTAENNQWQKCYGCRRVVELKSGCNHITCVCKSEFCYVCGKPWKTCNCSQWEEDRLIERAVAYVDNGQVPLAGHKMQGRELQIAEAAEHLREHHECSHENTRCLRQRGHEYQCETCNETYYNWIYQCQQCWMVICNKCRHNRV